jgi:hypothetical protein
MTRSNDLIRRSQALRRAASRAIDPKMQALYLIRANTLAAKAARQSNNREYYPWLDNYIAIQEHREARKV